MKPTIKIEPSNYKGWELTYSESHDHQSDWRAKKGAAFLSANKPEALIWEIDKTEVVTVRFKNPIKAIWSGDYSTKRMPVEIHTVVQDRIYFRGADNEEHCAFLKYLIPDGKDEIKFIHNSEANAKILAKHGTLMEKVQDLRKQGSEMLKRLRPVTDADVLIEAKK